VPDIAPVRSLLLATIVLFYAIAQGAHLTIQTWSEGYSPIWVGWGGFWTAALVLPLVLIWL
jgi:hypothetical protein